MTKTVSHGKSRHGTPEPQVAIRFPKGTSYRVVKAALHVLQVIAGIAKAGNIMRFVSRSVMTVS